MTSAPPSPRLIPTAPFLVWPVSRREFYLTLQLAMVPTLLWGITLFGWRVLALLCGTTLAATVVHGVLYRLTRRGKRLVYAHTIAAVLILVALCHPMWPTWMLSIAAATIPIAFWALGGPGRERIHVAVVWVVVMQLLISYTPHLAASKGDKHAILAHDRLLMGDIRDHREAPLYRWPTSVELSGDDALEMPRPQQVAFEALDGLSESLILQPAEVAATAETLPARVRKNIQGMLDAALSSKLPSVEALILGVVPGRLGAVSIPAILLGGLYLAYRHILRVGSVGLFLCVYALAIALLTLWPTTVAHLGVPGTVRVVRAMPGELLTLLEYATLNSDILFAAVFILAFPGTEPLTRRGRRVFLITAALFAAILDRLNLNIPAGTTAICLLMPLAPLYDHLFAKPSWLTRVY